MFYKFEIPALYRFVQIQLGIEIKNKSYEIKWSIIKQAKPYQSGTNHCCLCTQEVLCIINTNKEILMNQRSELISKCRNENKFHARNYKPWTF